jgi:hypothetical protein
MTPCFSDELSGLNSQSRVDREHFFRQTPDMVDHHIVPGAEYSRDVPVSVGIEADTMSMYAAAPGFFDRHLRVV